MRHLYRLALVLIGLIGTAPHISAQCDPILRVDSSQWIFNGAVLSSAVSGNTLYVGGSFTTMSKSTGSFVTIDAITANPLGLGSWPKTNGQVSAVIQDGSGGFIIAGSFTQVGATARNRIAQINAAGQVTSWNPDANGNVVALHRIGTTIYAGGNFSVIGGQSRNRIAAISQSTGLATSWDPNVTGVVNTITSNGSTIIYTGGTFTNIGGQTRNNLAALDATTGLATSWNPNPNNTVLSLFVNGTVAYVGGTFGTIGGQSRTNAAAINTTTGLATTWNPAPNGAVYDFALNGSNILLAGTFTSVGSQPRNGIGEVDANLGNATSLNYLLPNGSQVYKMKVMGNDLYLGGSFTLATGQANLLKINRGLGAVVASWEANLNAVVYAVETNATGTRVYAGGNFTAYYKNRLRIAAIDMITDSLKAWNPGTSGNVMALTANSTTVFVGGAFNTAGGLTRTNLAAIDATTAVPTSWAPNANSVINALVLNGNNLYVGGAFTSISTVVRNRAAAYDITSGLLSATWNPNMNGIVNAMAISGTNMILGGAFTTVGGSNTRNRIAEVSLSNGAATGWNPNADGNVNTLAVSGGLVYAGGAFNNIGGQFRPRLAAIDASTGNATSWQPYPNGTVNSIAIDGSKVYVGGSYTNNGGQTRTNLSSVDISSGNATAWDPAPNGAISHVRVFSGRLLVGGSFLTIASTTFTYGAQFNLFETAPVVTITGKASVCASTPTTYTAFTDVVNATYQWKRNGLNVGTNSTTYIVSPANNDQIQVVITAPLASCYNPNTATSNTITVTTTAAINPTVSVAGSTTVCAGTQVTYTSTTNVPNAYYVWRVNGNIAASGNIPAFTYTPTNGDFVYVQVYTPAEGCFTTTTATSNILNIVVNNPVAPTISISTPLSTVCAGASVTFTSTSNVTGGTYQWQRNAVNITGATASTYNTTTLVSGDVISVIVTIPVGGCFTASTANSNSITMTVNPNIVPTLTISGNTTPCASTTTIYTATTNVVSPTYQWKRNGINVGTNSATYSVVPATNDVITCVVTPPAGSCYTINPITSNALTITPTAQVAPTATVTGTNNICLGSSGTYSVTTNVVNPTYQWRVNGINVSTNPTYSYTPSNNDAVSVIITVPVGQGCYSASSVTSANFVVTVNNPVVPTISIAINPPNTSTVCSGTTVTYTATTNVTGGTYQWKRNGVNVGGSSPTINIVPVTNDIITCTVTIPSGGCFTTSTVTSAGITMTVNPMITPTINIIASTNNVCAGTSVNYTATTNVTGGIYQWRVNGVNVGTNSAAYSYSPSNNDIVTCTISTPSGGCFTVASAISNSIIMQINSPVTPGVSVVASANNICAGATVTYTATANIPGVFYLWKVNGVTVGTNSPTFSYQPANNDIVFVIITTPAGCFSATTASSPIIVMKVNAPNAHIFEIGAPGIAEVGSTVNLGSNIQAAITAYSIEWKKNGVTFGTTTTSTNSYIKAAGIDTIVAVITPADACYAVTTSAPVYVYSVGTKVNNVALEEIKVFPNPFTNIIKATGLKTGDNIALYDINGKKLQTWTADKNMPEHSFQINDLPGGTYMIRITDKENNTKSSLPLQKQ